jgi:hypothetical protein
MLRVLNWSSELAALKPKALELGLLLFKISATMALSFTPSSVFN